ncbi:PilN domain-containing protein [Wenzhouxiangella sp. XN79A]|uniref:PilN domain-containing protein n=1 Tax=Wenzhouxiangella sp. XN79A TaxID=2724193 RepID=UPI00144AF3EE|nr:PilN domain-containing protein [Wenzhouxiangella sp. XN79A]NKI35304.1 PilN domain-containing protein [Wenzhouxiangella sp. XN79A]
MRQINLLPWREEQRQERQRNFLITMAVVAAIAAGGVFAVKSYFDGQISGQNARNNYLRAEIAKLDQQIARIEQLDETRQRLIDRKDVIEDLQSNRTLMVHLFEQLVRTVPEGIRLLTVQQAGDLLTIDGTAQSSARVSTYLRNLESSAFLHDPTLRIVEAAAEETDRELPYRFSVRARLASPERNDTEEATAP